MTQYQSDRSGAADSPASSAPRRAPMSDNSVRAELRRVREIMQTQEHLIQQLQRDLRRLREQVSQHANTINRINRG